MKNSAMFGLLLAAAALAGCDYAQTLRFSESQALMPSFRLETDFRYHGGWGWSLPAAPGTPDAEMRDGKGPPDGGGFGFRLYGDWSHRQVRDQDTVRSGETAVVDDVVFSPGPMDVEGAFKINREDLGFKFMFFTRRYYFTAGVGVFWTYVWMDGSVHTLAVAPPIRSHFATKNWGPGFVAFAEVCPGIPEVRIYGQVTTWNAFDGEGYMVGTDREIGVKGRFRGISIHGGWRWEEIGGKTEHVAGESKLAFTLSGPVFGVGVTF
ncbi:MAG: hypothetical protein MUC63_00310 [Planctomycetes bacterium]|jgi:hypothetical protein|nr:hypothetical protein [Planctomycetota bacterium]